MHPTQTEELLHRLNTCYQAAIETQPDKIESHIRKLQVFLQEHPGNFEMYYISVTTYKPEGLAQAFLGNDFGVALKVELGFSVYCTECDKVHFMSYCTLDVKLNDEDAAFVLARRLEEILHG